jgi:hypothetical protein
MNGHFKKIEWKGIVKRSINTYWNTKLQLDCQSKSSLSLLSTTSLEMGKTHIVWDSINNSRYTTELAVLIGRDCRRFSVPIWKLERVAISFFFRFKWTLQQN